MYILRELYHALPEPGGLLDQDLTLLDLMTHAYYAAEMNGKSLAEIAQEGGHEFYIRTKKLADLIETLHHS